MKQLSHKEKQIWKVSEVKRDLIICIFSLIGLFICMFKLYLH